MIPDVSKALSWLEKHYTILQGIQRGLERETLRILPDGSLSKTPFPQKIGAALTPMDHYRFCRVLIGVHHTS